MNFKEFLQQEYALPEKGQKSVYISSEARDSIVSVFGEDAFKSLYKQLKYVDPSQESGNYLLSLSNGGGGSKRSFQIEITQDEVRILRMIPSRNYPLLKVDEPRSWLSKLLGV